MVELVIDKYASTSDAKQLLTWHRPGTCTSFVMTGFPAVENLGSGANSATALEQTVAPDDAVEKARYESSSMARP